jgi:Carboxypeptidase regulatory-like domain/Galactose oxidase, central domain
MIANDSSGIAIDFGGVSSGALVNSTFAYNEATNSWSALTPLKTPSPRADFAFAFDPTTGTAVLFGGLTNLSTLQVSNETWTYDVGASRWTLTMHGPAPPPREGAAFAVVPSLGMAFLYGGWNQNFSDHGSLTYSDLWEFNLSTSSWTNVSVFGPRPPPLEGAVMTWDPLTQRLEMFGGCYPCSAAVWQFDPISQRWTAPGSPSPSPTPRARGNWAFDPTLGADLLFGGTDGNVVFNDTEVFYPVNDTWVAETLPPAPAGRYDAASAFLNVSENETLLVAGGQSGATSFSDLWRLSATSNVSFQVVNASSPASTLAGAQVNLSGQSVGATDSNGFLNLTQVDGEGTVLAVTDVPWFYPSNRTIWLAPGLPANLTLGLLPEPLGTVYVHVAASSGRPLAAAFLNLTVDAVRINVAPSVSNASGDASFHGVPPGRTNVTAQAFEWRPAFAVGTLSPGGNLSTSVVLFADPVLTVRVLGHLPGGDIDPLNGAQVFVNGTPFALTNFSGIASNFTSAVGLVPLSANATGFTPASERVAIPFTGQVDATLVLPSLPFGSLDVNVRDANVGYPLVGATVIAFTPKPLKFGPFTSDNTTDVFGDAGFSLPVGNYSVSAQAFDYLSSPLQNVTVVSGINPAVLILLTPVPPATVHFRVRDQYSGDPIPGANVTSSLLPSGETDARGYYNATNIAPGVYHFTISAGGYLPNSTELALYSTENLTETVNLTPTFRLVSGAAVWGFNLFPGNTGQLWPFLLLPVLLLLGCFVFASARRGAREEESASGTIPLEPAADRGGDGIREPPS